MMKNKYKQNSNSSQNHSSKSVYDEVPTRKLISAYGGVGSVIETRRGSILIQPFNKWPYFQKSNKEKWVRIEDKRLLNRLKLLFKNVSELIAIPQNQIDDFQEPNDKISVVTGEYFPRWMFSPKSHRFDILVNWVTNWQFRAKGNDKDKINPIKCWKSYLDAINDNKKKKFYELEQVRFIMISSSGKIADVPWDYWVFGEIKKKQGGDENDEENEKDKGLIRLNFKAEIPQNVYYEYHVSDKINDFAGISIRVFDAKTEKEIKRRTLRGLLGLRVYESEYCPQGQGKPEPDGVWKVVIRSSNSVYYPNIINSLYLPDDKSEVLFHESEVDFIKKKVARGRAVQQIAEDLEDDKSVKKQPEDIQLLIDNDYVQKFDDTLGERLEEDYRRNEYNFITSKEKFYEHSERWLTIEPLDFQYTGIKKVYALDRLKMTSVQPSYTRQEPIDRDTFLGEDTAKGRLGAIIKKKYTHGWRADSIKYFPAVESFGEGVFIDFDVNAIAKWQKDYDTEVNERIGWIQKNFDENKLDQKKRKVTAKFVLIHTFCHLIIKELEFLCGYPASSLQERLYISDDMSGFLIYTIAGAEGSYGGLVSLVRSEQFKKLIDSALYRAKDCASDPICYHTDHQGQGIGGTNLAACFSCALLPETSCEEFNRFLDRKAVIDPTMGYFKSNLP